MKTEMYSSLTLAFFRTAKLVFDVRVPSIFITIYIFSGKKRKG